MRECPSRPLLSLERARAPRPSGRSLGCCGWCSRSSCMSGRSMRLSGLVAGPRALSGQPMRPSRSRSSNPRPRQSHPAGRSRPRRMSLAEPRRRGGGAARRARRRWRRRPPGPRWSAPRRLWCPARRRMRRRAKGLAHPPRASPAKPVLCPLSLIGPMTTSGRVKAVAGRAARNVSHRPIRQPDRRRKRAPRLTTELARGTLQRWRGGWR